MSSSPFSRLTFHKLVYIWSGCTAAETTSMANHNLLSETFF